MWTAAITCCPVNANFNGKVFLRLENKARRRADSRECLEVFNPAINVRIHRQHGMVATSCLCYSQLGRVGAVCVCVCVCVCACVRVCGGGGGGGQGSRLSWIIYLDRMHDLVLLLCFYS